MTNKIDILKLSLSLFITSLSINFSYANKINDEIILHANYFNNIASVQFELPKNSKVFFNNKTAKKYQKLIARNSTEIVRNLPEKNRKLEHLLYSTANNLNFDYLKKESKSNPISLLSEKSFCFLSKLKFNTKAQFIDKIFQATLKNIPNKKKLITYVSFVSGNFLSDCIILSKLMKAGYSNINIHLIDINHWGYINSLKCNFKPEVIHANMQDRDSLQNWLRFGNYQIYQFLTWLKSYSNSSKLKLYLHGNTDSFLKLAKVQNIHSDIFVGLDYLDQIFGETTSLFDFRFLALSIPKVNSLVCSLASSPLYSDSPGVIIKKTKITLLSELNKLRNDFTYFSNSHYVAEGQVFSFLESLKLNLDKCSVKL